MGLLNSVIGALGGGQAGGNSAGGDAMQAVLAMLAEGNDEGLGGLVQRLQQSGLGEQVDSWIGTGSNLPVAPEQLQSALGGDMLAQFGRSLGLSQGEAAQSLSQALPEVVDRLTPDGRLPPAGSGLGDIDSLLDRFSHR